MTDGPKAQGAPAKGACPICAKPATARYRPFCTRRCADVDLGKWLSGAYALPSEEPVDEEALAGIGIDPENP